MRLCRLISIGAYRLYVTHRKFDCKAILHARVQTLLGAVQESVDVIWDLHICFTQKVSHETPSQLICEQFLTRLFSIVDYAKVYGP